MSDLNLISPRVNRYDQLSNELRQRITDGEFKPGDKLPSFTEMRQQYGVSQSTLGRAHSALESEGLIVRKRGAGTFVLSAAEKRELAAADEKLAQPGFLSRAVAVFTPFAKPVEAHKSGGWLEWIRQGAVDAVQSAGLHVVTLHPDVEAQELQSLVRDRPYGVLVSAVLQENSLPLDLVRRLSEAQVPVVAYGASPEILRCDCVLSDHEEGAYQLTRFLIEKGRKRILQVCSFDEWPFWYQQRFAGYERAMKEAGLEVLKSVYIPDEQSLSASKNIAFQADLRSNTSGVSHSTVSRLASFLSAVEVSREDETIFRRDVKTCAGHLWEFLSGPDAVDALMMVTDRNVYLGAAICRMMGKDPNSDVLITGYDNYFGDCEEKLLEPFTPAATVDKNNQLIGATMAQLLFDRIEHRLDTGPQTRFIAPSLIVP